MVECDFCMIPHAQYHLLLLHQQRFDTRWRSGRAIREVLSSNSTGDTVLRNYHLLLLHQQNFDTRLRNGRANREVLSSNRTSDTVLRP